ncbi:MAG: 3-deoxy-D-manno-octulosonic-acid transferase [Lentimonas sp.]|jgi:3-deoxy-D-manno-octulosonic-acid transferase
MSQKAADIPARMIWIYRLLYLPALLVGLPYYLLRMWRRGGYRKDFQHRFGRFHHLAPKEANSQRVWLQAVSVGEVLAVGPLIDALQTDPSIEIVLTTTTSTGYREARKRYQHKVLSIGIFPLDFWLFTRSAWARIQPDCIILTESELWPEHLHQAKRRKVPCYLVNARISDRSFERYQKIPKLAARLLSKFTGIYTASELDRARVIQLGASATKTFSFGSVKFDVAVEPCLSPSAKSALREELGFVSAAAGECPIVLLGSSTWPGEERALIQAQAKLTTQGIDCRLLLVPRHAERAGEILAELLQQPLHWHQRSTGAQALPGTHIYLADTTGELTQLSQIAEIAFIGKSLPPHHGGQTPIEAASLGLPILMGPNMNNFKDVSQSLVHSGAARKVAHAEELEQAILALIKDPAARAAMTQAGRSWHADNRGSSQRIATAILAAQVSMSLERAADRAGS